MISGTHYLLRDSEEVPEFIGVEDIRVMNHTASPYFSTLHTIREELERMIPGFPHYRCSVAGKIVSSILGWEVLGGFYMPTLKAKGPLKEALHVWNPCPDGYWADITGDQQDPNFPSVVIFQPDPRILRAWSVFTDFVREKTLGSLSVKLSAEAGRRVDLEAIANDLRTRLKV